MNAGQKSASAPRLDRERMLQALDLAAGSFGLTEPNPRVGCVLGSQEGAVFGTGATQQAGGPHAEVMALRQASGLGHELRGATAWVTLEPCAHHGRTPPCCDALIEAGLARVVVGALDPFPAVNGAGIERLRAAGIDVDMAEPDLAAACRYVNIGFFTRVERGRPWVRLKLASSMDGKSALLNGVSQWITGPEARQDGHAWRRRASAVLTGIGTVLADDPRLDARLVDTDALPLRVVLDSRWRTPPNARLIAPPGKVLVIGAATENTNTRALQAAGAELQWAPGAEAQVDLHEVMTQLAHRVVNELHIEAGPLLSGALLAAGLVDEMLVYLSPMVIGPGRSMLQLPALERLADARRFEIEDVQRLGSDVRIRMLTKPAEP
jgi:diaminohydroxyphosphoribosylaminopyrimidine deaminase/5-amino-6-(5-phosphoribosylamino)uracil reductase